LKLVYAEWWYYHGDHPDRLSNENGERYSAGLSIDDYESAALFNRLGLVLPIRIPVEEYRRDAPVRTNRFQWDEPELYVEAGDKAQVLSDLTLVDLTGFGEQFCKAVIGDVKGVYTPPERKSYSSA
jgi:hypothetical protein